MNGALRARANQASAAARRRFKSEADIVPVATVRCRIWHRITGAVSNNQLHILACPRPTMILNIDWTWANTQVKPGGQKIGASIDHLDHELVGEPLSRVCIDSKHTYCQRSRLIKTMHEDSSDPGGHIDRPTTKQHFKLIDVIGRWVIKGRKRPSEYR
ncbi:MAG: hypothetical protein EA418_10825 [Wenzhouxiangellaceae bacterium]|nr:MAG: hypothetical protein EA418_10825 [Wenzhouxiangellaceae bacterium]